MTNAKTIAASLSELAERCEKAEGPDRQLDAMIHWQIKDGCGVGYTQDSPAFTSSLDAAMTLYIRVPERVPSNPREAAAEALRQRAEAA